MLSVQEKVDFLKTARIFSESPEEILYHLAEAMTEVRVKADEEIIKLGDEGNCTYLVVEGNLKIHQGRHILNESGNGETIGEFSLVNPESRSASVTTLIPSFLLRLENEDFHRITSKSPEVFKGIVRELVLRVREQNKATVKRLKEREDELEGQVNESREELKSKNAELKTKNQELHRTLQNLKATQTQLIESEKQAYMGNMLSHMAHEINTPVGIGITAASDLKKKVELFADKFKKKQIGSQDLIKFLENTFSYSKLILNNLQRAGNLVKRYKRLSADQHADEMREFSLKGYLDESLLNMSSSLKKTNIEVSTDDVEDIQICSYPIVFWQIISNLITNSLMHGFEQGQAGHIFISGNIEGERLKIIYQDDGKGISQENIDHIFEPFFTTNLKEGTGLGLHIIHNMVTKELKGNILCESRPGNGVKFIVDIPKNLKDG